MWHGRGIDDRVAVSVSLRQAGSEIGQQIEQEAESARGSPLVAEAVADKPHRFLSVALAETGRVEADEEGENLFKHNPLSIPAWRGRRAEFRPVAGPRRELPSSPPKSGDRSGGVRAAHRTVPRERPGR